MRIWNRNFLLERVAYLAVITLAFFPWLALAIRFPYHFYVAPSLLHFSTIYFFASLMKEPESLFEKIAAPVSLTIYISYGQDWPIYIFCLSVFFFLSGKSRAILRNPYNAIPAIAILFLIAWTAALTIKFGEEGLRSSRLLYPFWRLGTDTSKFAVERLWKYTLLPWGPQMLLAFTGLAAYALRFRKQFAADRVSRSILDSMCIWLILATPPLAASSGIPLYVYVVVMPTVCWLHSPSR